MGAGVTYKYTTARKHKYKNDDGERSRDEIKELKSSGQVSCSASFLCTVTRHHQPRHHRHHHAIIPGRRIHASLQAWLAGSEQPRRLQDKKYQLFALQDNLQKSADRLWDRFYALSLSSTSSPKTSSPLSSTSPPQIQT